MNYDEFLAKVRERGEYAERKEAEHVTLSVLEVLRTRLPKETAEHLAAQLPAPMDEVLLARGSEGAESYGVDEFCRRVAERIDAVARTAVWDSSAVLSTLAEAVSGGEVHKVLSRLPSGYAVLFGKPALSD